MEDNITNVALTKNETKSFITGDKKLLYSKLTSKSLANSRELKTLFDSLLNTCKKLTYWTFDVELISYKCNKSNFLSNISKLQLYLNTFNPNDDKESLVFGEIWRDLCNYFLELLCEADLLSITKNYSNKIISTIKLIPNTSGLIYSYLIDLCSLDDNKHTSFSGQFNQTVKRKFRKIYTILSSDLISILKADDVSNLLNGTISLYLSCSEVDFDRIQQNKELNISQSICEYTIDQHNNFEGIKCINVLLYNKIIKKCEVDKGLIERLLRHLLVYLQQESSNYQLISSFTTCFIGLIPFSVDKNNVISILRAVTTDISDFNNLTNQDCDLVSVLRGLPKLNYIYVIRSIIIFLHSNNYTPNDVFGNDTFQILSNCNEIMKVNLLKNNHFIINYSLLQTVQSYTIFINHHNRVDLTVQSGFAQPYEDSDRGDEEANRNLYVQNLIELSGILVNYFNNKIKTISHLSIYIYKKLLQSLSLSFSCTASEDEVVDNEKIYKHKKSELINRGMLADKIMKNMKASVSVKNKYIILDTVIKLMSVEKLLEYEPYILLHMMINIANNKSTVSSLLSQLLSQIKTVFKRFVVLCCNEQKEYICSNMIGNVKSQLDEIVFKCYLYPLLICIINDYRILSSGSSDNSEYLMPVNTDVGQEDKNEYKRERCDSINKLLMSIIPNYSFDLLKIANEFYKFDYFEYLPQNSKKILNDREIDLDNITTNLREFCNETIENIVDKSNLLGGNHEEALKLDSVNLEEDREEDECCLKSDEKLKEEKRMDVLECEIMDCMMELEEGLINDEVGDLVKDAKIVELYNKINYYESMCLYSFRSTNKLYFVDKYVDPVRYNGIMVLNCSEGNLKNKNLVINEVYYIDIRRYMFSMYYAEDIEIVLNLVKCIADCKKISKLISSNEFTLIKFVLKHVIILINLSNQHYFTQLIQLFLRRLKYNYDDVCSNGPKTNSEHSSGSDDGRSDESIKEHLVGNLKEIMEILSNNINVYNNENKIMISLNLILYICEMFVDGNDGEELNEKSFMRVNDKESVLGMEFLDDALIRRLFNLFYILKPCNHKLLIKILSFVRSEKIRIHLSGRLDELARLLLHFNPNKYEIASNILALYIKRCSDDKICDLFLKVRDLYSSSLSRNFMEKEGVFEEIKGLNRDGKQKYNKVDGDYSEFQENNKFDETDCPKKHVVDDVIGLMEKMGINLNNEARDGKLMMLNTVYTLILDYSSHIKYYLDRNVTVSGLINLLNNLMEHMDGSCVEKLGEIYRMLLKLLNQVINDYLSPKVGDDLIEEGSSLDCRGYYINKLKKEEFSDLSNVSISCVSCKCPLYGDDEYYDGVVHGRTGESIKKEKGFCDQNFIAAMGNKGNFTSDIGVASIDVADGMENLVCKIGRRYEMTNRNENKLFNYMIYKMVQELADALQSMVSMFTNSITGDNGWSKAAASERLDELIRMMMYCIINCRHVGCNDMFNGLLSYSLQKMLEFKQNNCFLYKYIYYLTRLIVCSHADDQVITQSEKNEFGLNDKLLTSNVIDIQTRSEHLSLIFISLIKSESNKKVSDLNNRIILILLYILNSIESRNVTLSLGVNGVLNYSCVACNNNSNIGSCGIMNNNMNDVIGDLNLINSEACNADKIYKFRDKHCSSNASTMENKDDLSNYNNEMEPTKELEDRGLIVINILNILRYIYRCIDMKYMNGENVVEVLRVCLRHMKSSNWSVKNASSLLLSTILSSLNSNHHLLSTGLLTSAWLLGDIGSIIKNCNDEVAYYTLYVLQLMLNHSGIDLVELFSKTDLESSVKKLLGSGNLNLRRMAALVLTNYYVRTENELEVLHKLENGIESECVDNNYLNGYLMLIKNTLELTSVGNNSNNIKSLLEILKRLCNRVNSVENYMIIRQIINKVSDNVTDENFKNGNNNNDLRESVDECLNKCKINKYHESELLELNSSYDLSVCLNLMDTESDNIYLIMKYFELMVQTNDLGAKTLNNLYRLLVKYNRYVELYAYYFRILNKLVQNKVFNVKSCDYGNEKADVSGHSDDNKGGELFGELFDRKYISLVDYCITNELTSNTSVYTELFKSLYYYFLIFTHINSDNYEFHQKNCNCSSDIKHKDQPFKASKIKSHNGSHDADALDRRKLLGTLGCLLMNNNSNDEMELNIRLNISSLYLDTFQLIRPSSGNYADEYEVNLIRKNWICIFGNILTLLQDDNAQVRTNIMSLIRVHIVNASNINYHTKVKFAGISYELRLLEYIVNAFDINDTISLFHYYLLIDLNTIDRIVSCKIADEQIYEQEENNMYREQMLIVKSILAIVVDYVSQQRFIKQIHLFLSEVIISFKSSLESVICDDEGDKELIIDKLNRMGLKATKYIITNTIILFLLLSIKIYLNTRYRFLDVNHECASSDVNLFTLIHGIVVNQYPSEDFGLLYLNLIQSFDEVGESEKAHFAIDGRISFILKNILISL